MNFLIFREFFEFKIDLFDFYFRTCDVAISASSDRAINRDR